MNRQIIKLFGLIVVLFAVLIGFTSYWSVFDAKALREKNANKRPLLEQQQIQRGRILAADGTVIARSVAKGHGSGKRYVRRYPQGRLYGHPIGYSFVQFGDSEFERFHNDELVGNESDVRRRLSLGRQLPGHLRDDRVLRLRRLPLFDRLSRRLGGGAVRDRRAAQAAGASSRSPTRWTASSTAAGSSCRPRSARWSSACST